MSADRSQQHRRAEPGVTVGREAEALASPAESLTEPTFYDHLIDRLTEQRDSVDVYSISACFGFYSQGMQVFSKVLVAMLNALLRPGAFRTRNMRLLLITDDNPVDSFGVERFHRFVEPAGLKIKRLSQPERPEEWVQFAVFDGRHAILTRPAVWILGRRPRRRG